MSLILLGILETINLYLFEKYFIYAFDKAAPVGKEIRIPRLGAWKVIWGQ